MANNEQFTSPDDITAALAQSGYVADDALATSLFLVLRLGKPLLLEGHAGVGKTEAAAALALMLDTPLIRLQCYEGLDVNSAVYEWNYGKQLLAIRSAEAQGHSEIFGRDFLLERPLLKAITQTSSPVLLIDEVDRADEEFEAFLLELLSAFQISIPELGTIVASHPPYVILTSNRTRELSDATKRRCLYHWIDYPDAATELRIVHQRLPLVSSKLSAQVVACMQELRKTRLNKTPGVAETIDWLSALLALGSEKLSAKAVRQTLGCILKTNEDQLSINDDLLEHLLTSALEIEHGAR